MNGSAKPATRARYPSMPSAMTLISAAEDELMAAFLPTTVRNARCIGGSVRATWPNAERSRAGKCS